MSTWQPIESAPEGEHIALWFPVGERGNGGIECATLYKDNGDCPGWAYWSHGGPNSGWDWEPTNNERPTHWMPLPEPPK